MWKFDRYGNAKNTDTEDEIYSFICPDGLVRVYHNDKIVAVFHNLVDAEKFIKEKVHELEIEEDE